ncbi:serine/threonine-protein kinase/endoribonuclease IRE2-like [Scomber japonicus]|uniref:serine/threonine-protein kinase/endoribonuclease IRE2-like n=1 Tax=Scomber japonicus TaxID=13676 RepID=UPI0023069348|nr:serine/threonine-protein kinase/endoribonuclease IRE2-like [Scomber japonicus]
MGLEELGIEALIFRLVVDRSYILLQFYLSINNIWNVTGRVRLAGFGLCRWSPDEETTLYTGRAEPQNCMASETLTGEDNGPLNCTTDIKAAGMLVDYVLSRGQHQFNISIHERKYNLDQDFEGVLAKDLIEWMTDKNPNNRPGVQNCLNHPFLWSPKKKLEYLINIGKMEDVAMFKGASQTLISSLEAYAPLGYFRGWKNKFPADLVELMDGKKKEPCYTDNAFGLLRFIRNAQEHYLKYIEKVDVISAFPPLFGCAYKFAKSQRWNLDPRLKQMFITEDAFYSPPATSEENLSTPVQESQQVFTVPFTLLQ